MDQPDTPTAGRIDGRAHLLAVRIYYEDTDFSGVVYHANYLRYFERGRSDFLRLAGVHHADLLAAEKPIAFAVRRMEVEFHGAARIDDALTVETRFVALKGPRVFVEQALRRGPETLVTAKVEAAVIGLDGRAKKPPALLAERLKPFLEPSSSSF
jgi:acyl-CoA thioester hydrolase